ncbi:MAG: helix-turn-helix transcriptional regulator [Spirochaetaceae bacterium]|jgi:transcriptional regulator with XRE-family HTH domain|nr:helix-turn-helix transcriptional regulator [Spirochaetaceae bacterium]
MTYFQRLFTRNLRIFRKLRGYSQLQLSELVNISPNYLNAVENGKNFPSPDVIQKLLDALEITPFELFSEYSAPPSAENTPAAKNRFILHELNLIKEEMLAAFDERIQKYRQ